MAIATAGYAPVNILGFTPGQPPLVNLYLRVGNRHVLYCRHNEVLTEAAQSRLADNEIATLFVLASGSERDTVPGAVRLSAVLELPDSQVSPEIKADLLYRSALSATKMIFTTKSTDEKLLRANAVVKTTTEQLARNPAMLKSVVKVLQHDFSIYTHTVNVCAYTAILARCVGQSEEDAHLIGLGAILHDVGKTKVPLRILQKNGPLTEEEWVEVRRHPDLGVELIGEDKLAPLALQAVRYHHERLDGSGYPLALEDGAIDEAPRLVAIADVFDALTAKRPYRPQLNAFDALNLMRKEMTQKLDPELFAAFVRMLGEVGM